LAPNAYLFRRAFTASPTRIQQEKTLEEASYRLEKDMNQFNSLAGAERDLARGRRLAQQQADNQQTLLARLRQIRPIGPHRA